MDTAGSKVAGIVKRFLDELHRMGIDAERVLLYGSHARGEAGEASDIDVLVVSPDFRGLGTRERLELLGLAAARIWEPVEAIGFTPEEAGRAERATLLEEVLRTGVALS